MRVYEMGPRAPLYTCRGRAVGLLHVWQGGYAKTVSGYGKRVQHRQTCNRPRPMRVAARLRRDFGARLAKDWAIPFGTRRVAPSIWPATRLTRGI